MLWRQQDGNCWFGPDEGPAAPRVPCPAALKDKSRCWWLLETPSLGLWDFVGTWIFSQNLVFPVPRQLLLLQDSFLPLPVTEFAQCYFLNFFFLLEMGNAVSCNSTWWGGRGVWLYSLPSGSAGALGSVLAVPCAAPPHAQH